MIRAKRLPLNSGKLRSEFLFVVLLLLSGCSGLFTEPMVRADGTSQVRFVEVELTPEAVAKANLDRYAPRQLPSVFYGGSAGATSSSSPPPPRGTVAPYRIGVGDIVAVKGKSLPGKTLEQDFSVSESQFQIRDDGTIDMPGIGVLKLGGKTVAEADTALSDLFVRQQIDPTFRIEMVGFNARSVVIDGDVGTPGVVQITQTPLTINRALASRGGIRAEDRHNARVVLFRDGKRYSLRGDDVTAMAKVVLRDNDSLVVEAGRAPSAERTLFESRAAHGAEPRDHVYIAGEVANQKVVELPFARQLPLTELLLGVGGIPLNTGDLAEIYIIRTYHHAGTATVYHLNAANVVNLALANHFELRPRDIVFVTPRPVTQWSRVMSQLAPTTVTGTVSDILTLP